jgi:pullulanase/glycogen debranching enzyme
MLSLGALLVACGGGYSASADTGISLNACDANFETVLKAVPAASAGTGGTGGTSAASSLTVHYRRVGGDYTGWQVHSWGAGADPGWNQGYNPTGTDSFGAIYSVALASPSGSVGYLFHNGDTKDHGGADQSYTLTGGANEIWRIEGDAVTYLKNPVGATAPDISTVRVHYKRFDGNYSVWGLHLWNGGGANTAALKATAVIENWGSPVLFSAMNNYSAASSSEVVFDIPVLNPKQDASRTALEFIIHGTSANPAGGTDNKDGWSNNIRVDYAALTIAAGVGEIWLVQGEAKVYTAVPDLRSVSTTDARAYWLNQQLIQWPKVDASGVFKLYYSSTGQVMAAKDGSVSGAEGSFVLNANSVAVPAAALQRFKFVAPGVVLAVKAEDQAKLQELLSNQFVLVQEDASGKVQNASTAQIAGALDSLFASAASVPDLGVRPASTGTSFKLWAPTAQQVAACVYDSGSGKASGVSNMKFDPANGVWTTTDGTDQSGKYYKYVVDVFVRGKGLVRNLVTDPYSVSLTTDSKRSFIASLDGAGLKPAGWDTHAVPAKVADPVDMSIYELHVRDFSANDSSVPEAQRGKYLAFTNSQSNGMKHLKALADAGLTDVHLLPIFDLATIPETGCVNPAISGGTTAEVQQAAINAVKDTDCFNWGYDPYHYSAPEGSYASDAADGAKRVLETRQMVMALHQAGLRVGMDVVYNHTTASGQVDKSVLDRVVPGYYHRLNATGDVEKSTCCDNTATENLMMGKLMTDSVSLWATQYRIDSFRFDLMGHQPRAAMLDLRTKVAAAAGHPVQIIGEGWNFGEVANGARFEQASQLSLNGSGIGTFSDRARDHIRGGGPFDGGADLVKNQGFINGLFYDDNGSGAGKTRTNLMWSGDIIKSGLAGSIRDFSFTTHWDEKKKLEELDYNGQPAGYVTAPQEVVNYVENHDNQTLFDINAYKLPAATSREDRARVQMLGAAINAFSQGISYYHAGIDTLRSKSMDRNSYNSGDWFNRLDWTYADNYFGTGLPMKGDNGDNWSVILPILGNAAIKPTGSEIALARDMFRDLLKIRASTTLLRLRSAADIKSRLHFHNTGAAQVETVLVGQIDGEGYVGANAKELVYLINVDKVARNVTVPALAGKAYTLHPVQAASTAADRRPANDARYESVSGKFTVPARTAVVYVVK